MEPSKPHIAFRVLKVVGWILLTLLILSFALRLSLKTGWVQNFAKEKATELANKNINGSIRIQKLEGDLWKSITLTGISLTQQNDTLLSVDTLQLNYRIMSLLNEVFDVDEVLISGLAANVREEEDSTFNVQKIFMQGAGEDVEDQQSSFSFDVEQFRVRNSKAEIFSPSYLPDSTLKIDHLLVAASFGVMDEFYGSLNKLDFSLREGRLPHPIEISAKGNYQDQRISLNELLIETGRSYIRSSAQATLADSSLSAASNTNPLDVADLRPYFDTELSAEKYNITLRADGKVDSLNFRMYATGDGFDSLKVTTNLMLNEGPALKKLELEIQNFDIAHLTSDSVDAHIQHLNVSLDGFLPADHLEKMNIQWAVEITGIRFETHNFSSFSGDGFIRNGDLQATLMAETVDAERVSITPKINRLFAENPKWNIRVDGDRINLAKWAQNPELDDATYFSAELSGAGFILSEKWWEYSIINKKDPAQRNFEAITLNGAEIAELKLEGRLNEETVTVLGYVKSDGNVASFHGEVGGYQGEEPTFKYHVEASEFNAGPLTDLENFATSLNLSATGSGRYFDPEKMELTGNFQVDSSIINGAVVELPRFDFELRNGVLTIPEGKINSEIISGTFSGRKNIRQVFDPKNELAVNLKLKNLQPLAPVMNAERLQAEGAISGKIIEDEEGILEFQGEIELSGLFFDDLFYADAINGNMAFELGELNGFDFDVNISAPTITGVTFRDVDFESIGQLESDSLSGNFRMKIESKDAGEITQMGTYRMNLETLKSELKWDVFNFQTPARLLSLQSPFQISYQDFSLKTDTLNLLSKGGSYFRLAVPYADSLSQQVWVKGQNFDFGIIQEILFGERFVDGVLMGEVQVARAPESLTGSGDVRINRLSYLNTEFDALEFVFDVRDDRLSADGTITRDGEEKVVGYLDVPFVLEDPASLDDTFFAQPVQGSLTMQSLDLSDFKTILQEFNITGTEGIVTFTGSLEGTAGEPSFDGRLNLGEPTLSSIKIDSAFAEFSYDHTAKNLFTLAEIHAKGQEAASINIDLPISMDFRTFQLNMPSETDTIAVHMHTNDFNLSVLNDFVSSYYLNNVKGILNADLTIEGPYNNFVPSGSVLLSRGEVTIPIAGITLKRINSEIEFAEDRLELKKFVMNSGGDFNIEGRIDLEGIEPAEMDLNVRARQFKVANTSEYNLTIDLNSNLTGSPMKPIASGNMSVRNGFYFLQDFGEKSVEDVTLDDEEKSTFSLYDSLTIDMQFDINRNFYLRNSRYLDMEVELTGSLNAQKEVGQDLQLFGALNGQRGYVRPLGKLFELEDASFSFSGPVEDPELFIRTSYIPQTSQKEGDPIVLYYVIEGTAQDPEFRFESDPPMEQQDIIAYTLFGRPFYALDSWQQVISGGGGGSSPTALLVDVLLDEVEALATREFGIDVVRIDNTRSGSDAVTSIKTGWYLNQRTFFSVVNEISSNPKTLFILEYMLTNNLDLILTQGNDNRQGIDIRWQLEY